MFNAEKQGRQTLLVGIDRLSPLARKPISQLVAIAESESFIGADSLVDPLAWDSTVLSIMASLGANESRSAGSAAEPPRARPGLISAFNFAFFRAVAARSPADSRFQLTLAGKLKSMSPPGTIQEVESIVSRVGKPLRFSNFAMAMGLDRVESNLEESRGTDKTFGDGDCLPRLLFEALRVKSRGAKIRRIDSSSFEDAGSSMDNLLANSRLLAGAFEIEVGGLLDSLDRSTPTRARLVMDAPPHCFAGYLGLINQLRRRGYSVNRVIY